jgi:hypothetical protein
MKWRGVALVSFVLSACGNGHSAGQQIADAQAKSFYGATAHWKLDPALARSEVQEMRDRAYGYCLREKPSEKDCFNEQDHSLFDYTNAFGLVRIFHSEAEPTFPYAVGHKQSRAAFERVRRYCRSVYEDAGSRDARSLGPCVSAGVGADFFGVVPVP